MGRPLVEVRFSGERTYTHGALMFLGMKVTLFLMFLVPYS